MIVLYIEINVDHENWDTLVFVTALGMTSGLKGANPSNTLCSPVHLRNTVHLQVNRQNTASPSTKDYAVHLQNTGALACVARESNPVKL